MKTKAKDSVAITTRKEWLRQWVPISLILLVATALYLYQLGTESLWIDEFYSIRDAKIARLSGTRPLYFILLRVWMLFGTSDAWLRGLSVLFGIGSVFLIYRLGRRLVGEPTGLLAAFILALSPLFINYAQVVRMYTLSTFLGIVGTLALVHAFEHPTASSMRWWAGARLLSILTTPLNVLLLLPDIVLFTWRFRKRRRVLLAFGMWLLLLGILWLPFAVPLATKSGPEFMADWVASVPKPGIIAIARLGQYFTVMPTLDRRGLESPLEVIFWLFNTGLIPISMYLLGMALLSKQGSSRILWLAAWAFLPVVCIFLISRISSSLWIPRYLLVVCPYILILLAKGFMRVWHEQRRVISIVTLVYIVALSSVLLPYYTTLERPDWRSVAQIISFNEKPGDVIALSTRHEHDDHIITYYFGDYYRGSAPIEFLESLSFDSPLEIKQQQEQNKKLLESWIQRFQTLKSRLWLVVYREDISAEQIDQTIRSEIGEEFHVQTYWKFHPNISLFLVIPKSSPTTLEDSALN